MRISLNHGRRRANWKNEPESLHNARRKNRLRGRQEREESTNAETDATHPLIE